MVISGAQMSNANKNQFTHLKIHTQYSICEGAVKIVDLKDFCKKNKIHAIGLSDTKIYVVHWSLQKIFQKWEHRLLLAAKLILNLKTK